MERSGSSFARVASPLLVLALYYWALFGHPPAPEAGAAAAGARLSLDESRQLAASSQELYLAGKYEEALGPTLELSEAHPNNDVYVTRLAEIYRALHRFREEAACWESCLAIAPIPGDACPMIGEAYWNQGLKKEAIDAYRRCVALEPDNPDLLLSLATAYERSGDIEHAREVFEHAHAVSPGYTDVTLGLARMQLRGGQVAEAKRAAGGILSRAPDDLDALLVMGYVSMREGKNEQARRYLERGIELEESYLDFHIALAQLEEGEGKTRSALRHYRRVLAEQPTNGEALEGVGRIEGGRR